jgi:O-acetyl-ADP-ribose deacetylase (regulator of RNase III)
MSAFAPNSVTVTLIDINPRIVAAWHRAFTDHPEVRVVRGSMLDAHASAWVTPTNARGSMDGGLDAAIKQYLGPAVEDRVRREIARAYHGRLPVGGATCVSTGLVQPAFLISAATMGASAEDIRDTPNVTLACAAALHAVQLQNAAFPGSIRSVALPGLGARTGRVPPEDCAEYMLAAYRLFLEGELDADQPAGSVCGMWHRMSISNWGADPTRFS